MNFIQTAKQQFTRQIDNSISSIYDLENREGNIAMFHFGRCGSTVLAELLKQHPDIHWDGEIYERMRQKKLLPMAITSEPMKILQIMKTWHRCKFYGFETKTYPEEHFREDLLNTNFKDYLEELKNLDFNYFIVLKRNNYLRQIVSLYIGWKTNSWHLKKKQKSSLVKINLDIDECKIGNCKKHILEIFQNFDDYYEDIHENLEANKSLILTYEDDILSNPIKGYREICDFLNIEYYSPDITLKKRNPYKLEDVIDNYQEVKEVLTNTKYEWMLFK